VPRSRPIAVAVRGPLLGRPLAAARADKLAHLRLHQLLHDPGQRLAQKVEPLAFEQVTDFCTTERGVKNSPAFCFERPANA
jgi:hypothetical protein